MPIPSKLIKLVIMNITYKKTLGGICVQRCYGLDNVVELPEELDGRAVTELDRYAFSRTVRGREEPPKEYQGEPEICGTGIEELVLPRHIRKVGAYALYNCFRLRKLTCWSSVDDWGAGVFTGCSGMERLDIRICPGSKSCFQDILSELHQTLMVDYRDEAGQLRAKLVFPEFFEESVENTPARIIMREMHGCGHKYRYCFEGQSFQFREYDRLFPHVQVQEGAGLVTQLAVYRLYWPWDLAEDARIHYWEYLENNAGELAEGLIRRSELDILKWVAGSPRIGSSGLEQMLRAASRLGNAGASALLMDEKHRRFGGKPNIRTSRTFEL